MGIISGSVSFRGRFGDHFGGCTDLICCCCVEFPRPIPELGGVLEQSGLSSNIWVGATKVLKPRPCIGQNIPKIHTLSRTTPSILLPCLEQRTKCTPKQTHVIVIARANPQYRKGQDNTRLENFSCRHHQLCIF